MYAKLTIPERLKDLRVVDKHLTLEQLAEQTGLSRPCLKNKSCTINQAMRS